MSGRDSLEYLYAVLRNDRADEQMYGQGFLTEEEYRKLFELVMSIESRYKSVPRIYPKPF